MLYTFSSDSEAKVTISKRFSVLNVRIATIIDHMIDTSSSENFPPISIKVLSKPWNENGYGNSTGIMGSRSRISIDDHHKIISLLDQNKQPLLHLSSSRRKKSWVASRIRLMSMKFVKIFMPCAFTSRKYIVCIKKTKTVSRSQFHCLLLNSQIIVNQRKSSILNSWDYLKSK